MKSCYMCKEQGPLKEHVPPKCLFPEQKDLEEGFDLRKSLITVPSCDEHNCQKSSDDEYLLYCLSLSSISNKTGKKHFSSKVVRAITRNPSLRDNFLVGHIEASIQNIETKEWSNTIGLKIDNERFDKSIEQISKALYFHHFEEKWFGNISIRPNFLLSEDIYNNQKLEEMDKMSESLFSQEVSYGNNPEVFKYKILDEGQEKNKVMRLYFYEGNRITIFFKK